MTIKYILICSPTDITKQTFSNFSSRFSKSQLFFFSNLNYNCSPRISYKSILLQKLSCSNTLLQVSQKFQEAFLDHQNNFISQQVRPILETKYHRFFNIVIKKKLTLKEKQTRHLFVGNGHLGNLQKSFLFPVGGTDFDFVSCFRFALSFWRPFS